MAARTVLLAATAVLFALTTGCATAPTAPTASSTGPPPATPAPAPPPPAPRVPTTQQDAQDGVTTDLRKALDAMPQGTTLDGLRYALGPSTVPCDAQTVRVRDTRDVRSPSGSDAAALVAAAADQWRQWGWPVDVADDQGRPGWLGHAPDGYDLRIQAGADATSPPALVGSSPCFAADERQGDVPRTPVLEQSP